jgi:uncharacterized protein YdaL
MARSKIFPLIFLAFFLTVPVFARESAPSILLLYHPESRPEHVGPFGLPKNTVIVSNLLGHFRPEISRVPVAEYFPGLMKSYGFVFYIGDQYNVPLPEAFLEDIVKNPQVTVVWIRWNIEKLLDKHEKTFGIKVLPLQSGFTQLVYNQKSYLRPDSEMVAPIQILHWEGIKTEGILKSQLGFTGFAYHSKNLWYFPDAVFWTNMVSYFVFADMLHDVLGIPHELNQRFFVRLEDIHPARDTGRLRKNCQELARLDTPFMLAVVPQYRKGAQSNPIFLKDKPYLLKTLKDCAAKGGSILLHGYTHQYKHETGEGHEFWDVEKDKPIAEYTESTIHEKMQKGIKALTDLELYPVAWETPHYSASQRDYQVFAQYFSMAVERRQITDYTYESSQGFPFIVRDIYGQTIVPENLGYINFETGETIERKLEIAEIHQIVRDSVVGVFYHPYFDAKYLKPLIKGLKKMGFAPLDLRDFYGTVKGEDVMIFSGISQSPFVTTPTETMMITEDDPRSMKVSMTKAWMRTFLLDYAYRTAGERWYKQEQKKDIILELPDKPQRLFLIRHLDAIPSKMKQFKIFMKELLIGETKNLNATAQRWIAWVLFGGTFVFLIMIAKIFLTRTSYHASHFRRRGKK